MNKRANAIVRFEPESLGLVPVTVTAPTWLPFSSSGSRPALNPALWQTRAARGFSWHRAGRTAKRVSWQ